MPVTIPQVEAARPEGLTSAAAELSRQASGLNQQITAQQAALENLRQGWNGTASDRAQAKAAPTLEQMRRLHETMTTLQTTLQNGGATLSANRTSVLQTFDQLQQQGWQVGPDGSVSVKPGSPLDQYAKASAVNAMRVDQLAAANNLAMKTALANFDTADRQLSQGVRTTVAGLSDTTMQAFGPGGPLPQTPAPQTGPKIPDTKDPVEVKDWWGSLSKEERDRLIREQPEKIGGLNGVPVEARSQANKTVMQRDIDRVEQRANVTGATVDQVKANPDKFGLTTTDITRYNNAVQVKRGLETNSANTGGTETFLYVYEPEAFNGQGRAAVAIGNPDNADNTAVVVPGTGNSVTSGWLSNPDAANVYNETVAADRNSTTSVVAWMGYNAPDSLFDPQVAQVGNAREGGNLLANDINALELTNRGDPHITVMGHSYGSTTVADACAGYGLRADDVVLVGSPGTDLAKTAADFNLPPGGQVYVGAASTDPITHLGGNTQAHVPGTGVTVGLGSDPADSGFGGTRFKAEVAGIDWPWKDHSGYYIPGSESLYSMAEIASGNGDRLDDAGMTARERSTIGVPIPGVPDVKFDPETYRPATRDHYH